MKNYLEARKDERGFTLMEMLIVVAIIAVLVAIAIPIFTNQLEKSREATDLANIRSGYAAATVKYLNDGSTDVTVTVPAQQKVFGSWVDGATKTISAEIGSFAASINVPAPTSASGWTIKAAASDGKVTVTANS